MLLFIHYKDRLQRKVCNVSIHLMLLFIYLREYNEWLLRRFNTSHVTLYRLGDIFLEDAEHRFNTSHVTLYPELVHPANVSVPFQYISCYSLSFIILRRSIRICVSIHLMLLFIRKCYQRQEKQACFNTSHVTLYRDKIDLKQTKWAFQYISCYSLSYMLCRY